MKQQNLENKNRKKNNRTDISSNKLNEETWTRSRKGDLKRETEYLLKLA